MFKKLLLIVPVVLVSTLTGCGGGSDNSGGTDNYDLSSYFIANRSVTKTWDELSVHSNGSTSVNIQNTFNTTITVTNYGAEILYSFGDVWSIYVNENTIKSEWNGSLYSDDRRFIKINDILFAGNKNCELVQHLNEYIPAQGYGYGYDDVLEFSCKFPDSNVFYAKNIGHVATEFNSTIFAVSGMQ